MVPTIYAAVVVAAGLFASGPAVIYWQVFFCLFGATAAVVMTALGGAPINPSVLFLVFLMYHAFRSLRSRRDLLSVDVTSFWLTVTVLWGALVSFLMPRVFEGSIQVFSVDRLSGSLAVRLMSLKPGSLNITQSAYAMGSTVAFLCTRRLMLACDERPGPSGLQVLGKAVLILGVSDIAAAFLNLAEFYAGFPPVLPLLRNANYAIFSAYEAAGLMRIQGTFPEASAFAGFSLPLFAFAFRLWMLKYPSRLAGPVAGILLVLLVLSTSGSAYAGLSMYFLLFGMAFLWNTATRGSTPQWRVFSILVFAALAFMLALFVFETRIATGITRVVDTMVLKKLDSTSGIERSSWNERAWGTFLESGGLGIGLGSTRASSWLLATLSGLGAVGTCTYAIFLSRLFKPARNGGVTHPIVSAGQHAIMAALPAASLAGPTFDLGLLFYMFAAAASFAGTPEGTLSVSAARSRWPASARGLDQADTV